MEWTKRFLEVVRTLDLDVTGDRDAARLLERLVKRPSGETLKSLINGRPVMIYGCGPSLEADLNRIVNAGIQNRFISLAADGAVSACLKYNILPHINVTDADGNLKHIAYANKHGTLTLLHAHSKNISRILKLARNLEGEFLGTSQSKSLEKVKNYGGIGDADRSAHIACAFGAHFIVFCGMDYGSIIGTHSGLFDRLAKPRSLKVSKMMIEDLASHSNIKMFNLTHGGDIIMGVKQVTIEELAHMVS